MLIFVLKVFNCALIICTVDDMSLCACGRLYFYRRTLMDWYQLYTDIILSLIDVATSGSAQCSLKTIF